MIEDAPQIHTDKSEEALPKQKFHEVIPKISCHAIVGAEHPQTIHVMGKLKIRRY